MVQSGSCYGFKRIHPRRTSPPGFGYRAAKVKGFPALSGVILGTLLVPLWGCLLFLKKNQRRT